MNKLLIVFDKVHLKEKEKAQEGKNNLKNSTLLSSSDDEDIFQNKKKINFEEIERAAFDKAEKQKNLQEQEEKMFKEAQKVEIKELFEEDLNEKNKFKMMVPQKEEEMKIFDYFDPNTNKLKLNKHMNPLINQYSGQGGFDIRSFRLRQAQQRNIQEQSQNQQPHRTRKMLGQAGRDQFEREVDGYDVLMPQMDLDQADKLNIDGQQVIDDFNNAELQKKDEEWMNQKRENFAFGGQSVKDRIKKRKQMSKLSNQANKISSMLDKRHKGESVDNVENNDEEGGENKDANKNKRQKF